VYIEIGNHDKGNMVLIKNKKQDTGYTEDAKCGTWGNLIRKTSNCGTWDKLIWGTRYRGTSLPGGQVIVGQH